MPIFHLTRSQSDKFSRVASVFSLTGFALLCAVASLSLTGCGLGKAPVASSSGDVAPLIAGALSGKTFGGPNPIIGATVKVYTTGNADGTNGGYNVATFRQEANAVTNGGGYPSGDTDTNGNFQFAGGYSCPAGQFLYLVSSGGNTGASSTASGATATAALASTGGVDYLTLTNGGSGYSFANVTIAPGDANGSGATAAATVSGGAVSSVAITSSGSGYDTAPIVTITGDGSGATATGTIGYGVGSIAVTTAGSGYYSATVTITSADGNGSGATAAAVINPSTGSISKITVTNAGSGYDEAPNVTISNPNPTNPANNQAVLVAALGRCNDLFPTAGSSYTGGPVYVNELTTVAAAYALGHFASDTGGPGSATVVSIGAPATNNAAEVGGVSTGCVAGDPVAGNSSNICAATAAAGLYHAFQNAANLVNVSPTAGPLTGANSTLPGASAGAVLPQQLVNSLGNILVSCVNSAGGSAGDGSACGKIFTLTTIGSSVPTDTFQAMVNLAANPTLNASTANVDSLLQVAGPFTSVYSPAVTSTSGLNDFSLAINYPAALGVKYDYTGALDANDVFYVGNAASSATAPVNILSFASNGALLGTSATNANFKTTYGMNMDALGHGYFGNGSSSGNNALGVFTTSGGVPSSIANLAITTASAGSQTSGLLKVYATAVDLQNNLWVTGATNSGTILNTLYMCPVGISATSNNCVGEAGTAGAASSTGVALSIDPNQNIWVAQTASLAVLENTNTVTSPTYPATIPAADTATVGPNPALGIVFTGSASDPAAYLSGYKTGTTGVQTISYTQSGVGVASVTAGVNQFGGGTGTATLMSGAYGDAADGNGTVWVADYNDHALFQTTPGAGTPTAYRLIPCLGGSTTCSTVFTTSFGNSKPSSIAIDSTGSIWITAVYATSPNFNGQVVQVIGSAAPAWPLLSTGKTGKP